MNTYYYNEATEAGTADILAAHLVPEYFDSVTDETGGITFVKDSETVATLKLTSSASTGCTLTAYTGGATTAKTRGYESTETICYSIHATDHAVAMVTTTGSGTKYVTIFTKNQNGDTVVISADADDYFAFSTADSGAPATVTTVHANDKWVSELVPFTTNTNTNGMSYTPYAFWLPITSNYPTTGSISYSFVRAVDQNNNEYFYNGYLAIA